MNEAPWPNLVAMFLEQAEAKADRPFLWVKRDGRYVPLTWGETASRVKALANTLRDRGLAEGDRVLILSGNSPEWVIADFAIMAAGGLTVPVYTTNTERDHIHILEDSGAAFAVVSTEALARPFFQAAERTGGLRGVVTVKRFQTDFAGCPVVAWDDALAAGAAGSFDVPAHAATIPADDVACLIYTSGTGGAPKGVMLSHRAIMVNCLGARAVVEELGVGDEVFLSFLPLSHAYEHTAGLMFPVSLGAEIYFAERIDTLITNLPEARPTIMTAVPRLYQVMRERILKNVQKTSWVRQRLFDVAVTLGRKKLDGVPLTLGERIADAAVERLVRETFRKRFGGRLKALVSGGAPLNYDVGAFFTGLGLRLLQGYGQTEAGPVIACNPCSNVKLNTVGPPFRNVEVRIAEDGEILVRGPTVMEGYWGLPELSGDVMRDGWLHTGDIGVIDNDGYLKITDRKKDIIVISSGDTISPMHVETVLTHEPEIEAAMVVGDNRPHLVGILVPAPDFLDQWAREKGVEPDLSVLAGSREFRHAVGIAVDRANKGLASNERVKRFLIAQDTFSTDNGMMTPTMKPRRHEILNRWGPEIDALY